MTLDLMDSNVHTYVTAFRYAQRTLFSLNDPTKFWYLATPYSKYELGHAAAFEHAAKLTGRLVAGGVNVFSPIVHGHSLTGNPIMAALGADEWLKLDTPYLEAAQGILVGMLPDWAASQGVAFEIDFMERAKKPVIYWPVPMPDFTSDNPQY